MSDNTPDICIPESDVDDIYTPERLDNSQDIHIPESGTDDICTLERLDNSPNIDALESDADDISTMERLDNSQDIHIPERSSTCNNQEYILKKAKKKAKLIRNFWIASFSFIGIIILLAIIISLI